MQTHEATTPFGRRPMSLGLMASQITAKAAPPETVVHKWHVFRDIKEARQAIGATDRALAILDALLSFHPETAFYSDSALVVWPSNEQLINRANGMSPATLRRHLANLVVCGLIIRRDSPNGKRYARKGQGGDIEQAFGFDLSPIVSRAAEFKRMAEGKRAEQRAIKLVKERLTICRRDVVKMIDAGRDEGVPGAWEKVLHDYRTIVEALPRSAPLSALETVAERLEELWRKVRDMLEFFVKSQNMNANESHCEHHIQNSKADTKNESEKCFRKTLEASGGLGSQKETGSHPEHELPLSVVLDACPNMQWMTRDGETIRNWRDFLDVVETARPALGISPGAWEEARSVMGHRHAAATLAAIFQKQDQITSPSGYLRSLTGKAKKGKFSCWPMIMALVRAKLDAQKAENKGSGAGISADAGEGSELKVSATLLKTLQKPKFT